MPLLSTGLVLCDVLFTQSARHFIGLPPAQPGKTYTAFPTGPSGGSWQYVACVPIGRCMPVVSGGAQGHAIGSDTGPQ